jgi:hypothetical protein
MHQAMPTAKTVRVLLAHLGILHGGNILLGEKILEQLPRRHLQPAKYLGKVDLLGK